MSTSSLAYAFAQQTSFVGLSKVNKPCLLERRIRHWNLADDNYVLAVSRKRSRRFHDPQELQLSNGSDSIPQRPKFDVILSHVVRNVPLPMLMHFLRSSFQLPSNLPMPYTEEGVNSQHSSTSSILRSWFSPLDPENSRIFVEVVGIRVNEEDVIPTMAMVAIKRTTRNAIPSRTKSLLEGTEKQIARALEIGLDEVMTKKEVQKQLDWEMDRAHHSGDEDIISNNSIKTNTLNVSDNTAQDEDNNQYEVYQKSESTLLKPHIDDVQDINDWVKSRYTSRVAGRKDVVVDVDGEEVTKLPDIKEKYPKIVKDEGTVRQDDILNKINKELKLKNNKKVSLEKKVKNQYDSNIVLDDIEAMERGEDLSPEELAKRVMEFGEKEKKRDKVGSEFVKTAFEEAKSLLRKQTNAYKELDFADPPSSKIDFKPVDEIDPQEELRKMFARGQEFAERKIVNGNPQYQSDSGLTSINDEVDIDSLINSDKTVLRAVGSVEDELAELQVRISMNGESVPQGGVLDLFEGPTQMEETDPVTATNYPGAVKKNVKMHSKLREALNQASFASDLLEAIEVQEQNDGKVRYISRGKEIPPSQYKKLQKLVQEAVEVGLIGDPILKAQERARLQLILDEISNQDDDRFADIASGYKDLLLSDNFVPLVRERIDLMKSRDVTFDRTESTPEDQNERQILSKLIEYAALLLKEARTLGAELEAMQLEIIRSICEVAMDPRHTTEEEAAIALCDAVRDMRPLLDETFVSYLKYAIAEEEGRLARRGLLDVPDQNSWLLVLKVIQQGVYAELAKTVQRHVDSIWLVLRMDTNSQRRKLLELLVDDLPSLDVRPFRKVVDNIVGALGSGSRGEFDTSVLGDYTNQILQLGRDIKEVLPPEKIRRKAKDADDWANEQRKKVVAMREEKMQLLKSKQKENVLIQSRNDDFTDSDDSAFP